MANIEEFLKDYPETSTFIGELMDSHYPKDCYLPKYVNRQMFFEERIHHLCEHLAESDGTLNIDHFMYAITSDESDVDYFDKHVDVPAYVIAEVSKEEFENGIKQYDPYSEEDDSDSD